MSMFMLKNEYKNIKTKNIKRAKLCKIQDLVPDSITIIFHHFLKDN